MELHERWLTDLRSERMKDKLNLAEGKMTSEEYMEQNNQKEIDLSALTIQEVYALRAQAKVHNNKPLLDKIYFFLNARSGGFAHTSEELKNTLDELQLGKNCPIRNNVNQKYGATGREHKFIEAGKLIQGNEDILVLVSHGTPEVLNTHTLQFWHLQEILNNAIFQEDPNSADIKNPEYTLMDPTFEERYEEAGLVQQAIKKADIVLELRGFNTWVITKTPHVDLDLNFLYFLKFPEVTLNELFVNNPKEVWVYIDHRQVDTNICENMYHAFAQHMQELGHTDIKLHLMSGYPPGVWTLNKEIVLMATPIGFFVDTAFQTPHVQKLISKKELFGYDDVINSTLTSQCRTDRPKLDDHEAPGHAYTLPAQAEQAREDLRKLTGDVNIADGYPKPGDAPKESKRASDALNKLDPDSEKVCSPVDPNTLMNRH